MEDNTTNQKISTDGKPSVMGSGGEKIVIPIVDEIGAEYDWDDESFTPCCECDGHDACRDFGCAFELVLGHMVKPPL